MTVGWGGLAIEQSGNTDSYGAVTPALPTILYSFSGGTYGASTTAYYTNSDVAYSIGKYHKLGSIGILGCMSLLYTLASSTTVHWTGDGTKTYVSTTIPTGLDNGDYTAVICCRMSSTATSTPIVNANSDGTPFTQVITITMTNNVPSISSTDLTNVIINSVRISGYSGYISIVVLSMIKKN